MFEQYTDKTRNTGPVEFNIRTVAPADLPALAEIRQARTGGEVSTHLAGFAREMQMIWDAKQSYLHVADNTTEIIGYGRTTYFTPSDKAPDNIAPEGWYLNGLVVKDKYRRQGVGTRLTQIRLDWISQRKPEAYYVVNARNRVSIELHKKVGFREITRDFYYPGIIFEGGIGVLYRINFSLA